MGKRVRVMVGKKGRVKGGKRGKGCGWEKVGMVKCGGNGRLWMGKMEERLRVGKG